MKIAWKSSIKYIIALGLGIGITLTYSHFNELISKGKKVKNYRQSAQNKHHRTVVHANKPLPFTNPLSILDEYKTMNITYMDKLEAQASSYINGRAKQLGVKLGVYFRDLNTQNCFNISGDMSFGPASLMKVPIMIAALKQADENGSLMSATMVYKGERVEGYRQFPGKDPGEKTLLVEGMAYSIKELIEYMIVESDNEATVLLLDKVGLENVEATENNLGYFHPEGFSPYGEIMTLKRYSSFFRSLYNASYLSIESSNLALEILSKSKYPNGIRRYIPPHIVISHKYGSFYLYDEVGNRRQEQLHHVGIVYYPNKPYLIGIISKGKSQKECEVAISELSRLVFNAVDKEVRLHPSTYLNRDIKD
jgi:beta-lactamase class A